MTLDDLLDFGDRWAFAPQVIAFFSILWQGWDNAAVRGLAIFLIATVLPSTIKAWRQHLQNKKCLDLELQRFDIRYQSAKSDTSFDLQCHVKVTNRLEDRGLERWELVYWDATGSSESISIAARDRYLKKNDWMVTAVRSKFSAPRDFPDYRMELRLVVTGAKPIALPVEAATKPSGYQSAIAP